MRVKKHKESVKKCVCVYVFRERETNRVSMCLESESECVFLE